MYGNRSSLSVSNSEALSLIYCDGCPIWMNSQPVRNGTRGPFIQMNGQPLRNGRRPKSFPSKTGQQADYDRDTRAASNASEQFENRPSSRTTFVAIAPCWSIPKHNRLTSVRSQRPLRTVARTFTSWMRHALPPAEKAALANSIHTRHVPIPRNPAGDSNAWALSVDYVISLAAMPRLG
jgi:hypothetical protein